MRRQIIQKNFINDQDIAIEKLSEDSVQLDTAYTPRFERVGDMVFFTMYFKNEGPSASSSQFKVSGLPAVDNTYALTTTVPTAGAGPATGQRIETTDEGIYVYVSAGAGTTSVKYVTVTGWYFVKRGA